MSSRQMKNALDLAQPAVDGEEVDDMDPFVDRVRSAFSFSVLDDSSNDDESSNEDDDSQLVQSEKHDSTTDRHVSDANVSDDDGSVGEENPAVAAPAPKANSKKKRKKKRKKQGKGGNLFPVKESEKLESEMLDRAVEQAMLESSSTVGEEYGDSTVLTKSQKLFVINGKHLNPQNEMKRIFGAGVVGQQAEGPQSNSHGGRGRNYKPGNKTRRMRNHAYCLSTPKEEWSVPPTYIAGGLGMGDCEVPENRSQRLSDYGCPFITFTWSENYARVQEDFRVAQLTHDPNNIAMLLRRYPFHTDALMQMVEIYKASGQMDHASNTLSTILYVLESAWPKDAPPVKPTTACSRVRMDFNDHNRAFFKALFTQMIMAGRTGCCQTAMELGKLILSLDPEGDPLGILTLIDYYAIRSQSTEFLAQLWEADLPLALASDSTGAEPLRIATVQDLPNVCYGMALSVLQNEGQAVAKEFMLRAVERHPAVVIPLIEAFNHNSATAAQLLSGYNSGPYRKIHDQLPQSDAVLHKLVELYVFRNKELWTKLQLEFMCKCALERALDSASGSTLLEGTTLTGTSACKYDELSKSDFGDEHTVLPEDQAFLFGAQPGGQQAPQGINQEMLHDVLRQFVDERGQLDQGRLDQLVEAVRAIGLDGDRQAIMNALGITEQGQAAMAGNLDPDTNPLLLFFQTLLPWNRIAD